MSVAARRRVATEVSADAAALLARMERVPFSRWHMRARIVMGSATFFDAFDALSLAFVLPVLIGLWHLSSVEIGFLISASYVGQLAGALDLQPARREATAACAARRRRPPSCR